MESLPKKPVSNKSDSPNMPIAVSSATAPSSVSFCGIDIAKETLEAHLLRPAGKPKSREFANTETGWEKLISWVSNLAGENVHFCMEATGAHSHGLAELLAKTGRLVSVVNPARVKYYGMSEGILNKTDPVDARVIAAYCREKHPEPWNLSRPEVRQLVALMRRLEAVQNHLLQEQNRLREPGLTDKVQGSIRTVIRFLEEEIVRLKGEIREHVQAHPKLQEDHDLLTSIPGIGDTTADWILAELPDIRLFDDAKSVAAWAGLSPREHTSGTSIRKQSRMTKAGNRFLRKALYMPAIAATRYNPEIKDLFYRLVGRGMHKKAAVGAAMRKLLMFAYGVLKSRTKWQENVNLPTAQAA